MKLCALVSCTRPVLSLHGNARYCSQKCSDRARRVRLVIARGGTPYKQGDTPPPPDLSTREIERRLAAIDAEKRRLTPKFGWQR